MASVKIAGRYRPHEPHEFAFKNVGESMTQKQFKKECDINQIMAKYRKTGMITHLNKHQGNFGDFASVEEYQTSLDRVMAAQDSFDMMPSELRARFGNNPMNLVAFLADPKNQEEAVKLGLMIKRPEAPPTVQQSMEKALENHQVKQDKKAKKD